MNTFGGPLFIVGMPRSGTKLLRDLLNQHPKICMPEVETVFFPFFIKKYGEDFDFNSPQKEQLFQDFFNTPFFWNMKRIGFSINKNFVERQNMVKSWGEFANLVFSFFGPKQISEDVILGDKTPQYIVHLELFKRIWPEAKFIHLIRDPRDVCISAKNIWNKSMFRTAYVWKNTIQKTASLKEKYQNDYIEIKYENLISEVETVMRLLSSFLLINYDPSMCELAKPAENYGDAKERSNVISNNKQKFLKKLSRREITLIEEITFAELVRLTYTPLYGKKEKEVNSLELFNWLLHDGYNSMKFHIKEKGVSEGLFYFFKLHKQSNYTN